MNIVFVGGGKMEKHFSVEQMKNVIKIKDKSNVTFNSYSIFLNHQLVANYYKGNVFYIQLPKGQKLDHLLVVGHCYNNGTVIPVGEQFVGFNNNRQRDFKPGDVLVASDNLNEAWTGYMGHSAIVVDENNLVEAPGGHPAIRKASIQQFLDKHPKHAQFRPKSKDLGESAASYAREYVASYQQKLADGNKKPVFSMKLTQSLKDPWEYIYCSKLVWLSYFHGADYELQNDYLWYSPEDLYKDLKGNDKFKKVYEHEEVDFHLDT